MDKVGQKFLPAFCFILLLFSGEFGIVYKSTLEPLNEKRDSVITVAVKTLKGIKLMFLYYIDVYTYGIGLLVTYLLIMYVGYFCL